MNRTLHRILARGRQLSGRIVGRVDRPRALILSSSRSGSNFLVSLLNSSPDLAFQGEAFKDTTGARLEVDYRSVYPKRSLVLHGAKIFYYHPNGIKDYAVWERLQADPQVRVIHLMRRNLLRAYISVQLAERSGVWMSRTSTDSGSIALDVEAFNAWRDRRIARSKAAVERLKGRPLLPVFYEDLAADSAAELERIAAFLGVPPFEATTDLVPQNAKPLAQLLSNFDAVRHLVPEAYLD